MTTNYCDWCGATEPERGTEEYRGWKHLSFTPRGSAKLDGHPVGACARGIACPDCADRAARFQTLCTEGAESYFATVDKAAGVVSTERAPMVRCEIDGTTADLREGKGAVKYLKEIAKRNPKPRKVSSTITVAQWRAIATAALDLLDVAAPKKTDDVERVLAEIS
jgi:hypothetical protein